MADKSLARDSKAKNKTKNSSDEFSADEQAETKDRLKYDKDGNIIKNSVTGKNLDTSV